VPDLSDFNPEFSSRLDKFKAALDQAGIGYTINSGYRSPEYQDRMYQNHLAKQAGQALPFPNDEAPDVVAKPWNSFHNYGIAADFSLKNDADYARLQQMAPQYGLSGIGMSDKGHIQLAGKLADDVAQYKLAGWRPASQPAPATGALAYSGPAGVLANQEVGPESVGSQPAYTFALPKNAPMGMGNNNPLNIKYYKGAEKDYPGLVGPSSNTDQGDPQMQFGSPEAGWNAAYNLLNKKYSGGMTTPNQIIAGEKGWTPGNTQAAANVAKSAGIGPDDDIGFSDPTKAKAFMRALVTQEQGAAGSAYPDEMIAASIGGNAPAAGAPTTAPTTGAPAVAAAPADQSWASQAWSKLTGSPVDAQGNPTGGSSPLQQLTQASVAKLGKEGQTEAEEAPSKAAAAMMSQSPGARNVSPGLANVSQNYGTTLNSFSQPLTWSSTPLQGAGMPAAGLQRVAGAPVPGTTLNSLLTVPGFDPNLGYGSSGVGYG
jgi:hypothetical protein